MQQKKYAFFDPLGFSILNEIDIQHIENGINDIIRNEINYQNQVSATTRPTSTITSSLSSSTTEAASSSSSSLSTTTATSSSSSKIEPKPSTLDEFLVACGESQISDSQNVNSARLTLDEELL
ncbi:unnamed protein product [Didymodactylos carnosus]|uniref:Uncharacterized protein n=1 Tax=Didymodactylos carnosus TaxID=1234261 RepID=A0A815QZL1_9BILA|nr:unnamed protein product [Didymodactylos carnosus]CAF4338062.1 unnamed protein product [Didymodactylos carnosus]